MNTKNLTRTALCMAIVVVSTMVIAIPIPGTKGFVNPSEAAIFLSVGLLPGFLGVFAGGFGCAIADLLLGYSFYAPATLVVKSLEALLATVLYKKVNLPGILAFFLASFVMPLGYFLYDLILYDYPAAIAAIIPNGIQGIFGAVVAGLIFPLLKRATEHFW
ncbi:ECF transporter S component [Peptoniphilus sp. KCTC 25270]|uniref:ECF transporter S component n=1 Tax=Peptoniphilus sp. KCTC 25270 TaxID=2897414 RepID=UPI001E5A39B1|nr:ECF transporter S component [Peptoniphilus sp. KCTC 25270]MCD1147667.1 ECF transporter S component [Peptoniphilus sp. KCTC 25270]